MEVEANDTLPFLDVLIVKRGPKLATKLYRKTTHTGCTSKSNNPHHVKRSVSRAKVICRDQKVFNNEIKNIRHDLMLNEYTEEFVDSVMKPSTRNRPSSDKIYEGTVINPHVKGISEKF
jgi:hypothetical protein